MTCDSSNLDTTGPSFEAKTIGYSSRFLAFGTLEIPGPNCNEYVVAGGFHTIDFADLYYNPITTTTMYKPGCPPYANPRLSLPAELTSVDPAWANCEPLFYGAFDPPRFLKKASGGMAPQAPSQPTAMAAGDAAMSEHPAAQATPAPVTPAPTATGAGSPLDPSQKAAAPAPNAVPTSPPQPPQVLPASPKVAGPPTPPQPPQVPPANPNAPAQVADPPSLPQPPQVPPASPNAPAPVAGPPSPPQPPQVPPASPNAPAPVAGPPSPPQPPQVPPASPNAPAPVAGPPSPPQPPQALPASPNTPAQVAGSPSLPQPPPSPPQPPPALPANPNTPANAAQVAPASARQSSPGVPDPGNLSPDQMSQLHQVLQSTPPAKSVQPQVNPDVPAVKSGDNSALAVPVPAPGSSVSSVQQVAPVPDAAPKMAPGSQSVPASAPAAVPPLVKPGDGAAKGGNAESSITVGSVGPAPAPAQSIARPQNGPSPVLVDPKNGALVEASPNSPFIPASVQGYPPSPIPGSQTSAIPETGKSGNVVNPANGVLGDANSNSPSIPAGAKSAPVPIPGSQTPAIPDTGKTGNVANPANGVLGEANSNSPSNPGGAQPYSPVIITGSQESAVPNVGKSGIAGNAGSGALVGGSSNDVVYAAPNLANAQPSTAPYQSKANGYLAGAGAPNGGVNVDGSGPTKGGNANGIGNSDTATGGPGAPAPLVIDGKTVHKASDGALLVAGQTLPPGSQATVSGAVISVDSSHVIVDGTTHAYLPKPPNTATPLIVNGKTAEALSDGGLLIADQTLAPGSQATMSGAVVSVDNSNMIVDRVTHALPSKTETPLIVNGKTAQRLSDGGLLIAGQTLAPGSQATVSGAVVANDNGNVIVDGVTHALPSRTETPLIVNGKTAQILSDGGLLIAGQTLAPGSQATVSGAVVSVDNNNVVVDGITHAYLPVPTPTATPIIVNGKAAQILPNGGLIIASQTLTPGTQATVAGAVVSVGAGNFVVDGTTHALSPPATESPTPLLIAGQSVQKASDGAFIVGSMTITQGSQATIAGHVVSVGASALVIDASTHSIPPNTLSFDLSTPLSIAGYPIQKASGGALVIGSQTIPQGSVATISGTVISAGSNNEVILDGTTHAFPAPPRVTFTGTALPLSIPSIVFTTANTAITLTSGATFQSDGRVVTYTGASVSVVTEATSAISGTVTVAYQASSEPAVIGGMIASAFGSGAAASSGALLKGSGDPRSAKVSGKVNSGPALGAGGKVECGTLLMNGVLGLLGLVVGMGLLG